VALPKLDSFQGLQIASLGANPVLHKKEKMIFEREIKKNPSHPLFHRGTDVQGCITEMKCMVKSSFPSGIGKVNGYTPLRRIPGQNNPQNI
jgi:hypothetical protein